MSSKNGNAKGKMQNAKAGSAAVPATTAAGKSWGLRFESAARRHDEPVLNGREPMLTRELDCEQLDFADQVTINRRVAKVRATEDHIRANLRELKGALACPSHALSIGDVLATLTRIIARSEEGIANCEALLQVE